MPSATMYNWNELQKESPRHGIERIAFKGDNAMVVLNWIKPGMQPGPHSHPFEQLVLILQGQTRLHVGDEVFECGPGSMVRSAERGARRRGGGRRGGCTFTFSPRCAQTTCTS